MDPVAKLHADAAQYAVPSKAVLHLSKFLPASLLPPPAHQASESFPLPAHMPPAVCRVHKLTLSVPVLFLLTPE